MYIKDSSSRRAFLRGIAGTATALAAPGVFAEFLTLTPRQTEGPFYPTTLPLDTDNDLILVNDALDQAVGEITHLTGTVTDAKGNPLRNAVVEIWQVDNHGVYLHPGSDGAGTRDGNFQGFGRFLTGSDGQYYFRTIKPVPYAQSGFQRAPHIHVAVHPSRGEKFTTQCYVNGHPMNERDSILRAIQDDAARASVIVDFTPIPDTPAAELAARFDIVLSRDA